MNRLEKTLKKQLDDNTEAIDACKDKYISTFDCFRSSEERKISEANLNIQKILTDIANRDSEDVISDIYNNLEAIDDANSTLDRLERVSAYLNEEIAERKVVKGLHKTKE